MNCDWVNVQHVTVTNFNIISGESFLNLVVLWEVFVYIVKETSIKFCCHLLTNGWVKPNDISHNWHCLVVLWLLLSLLLRQAPLHKKWSFLRIWSHLLKKSLMENFIFCAVPTVGRYFNPVKQLRDVCCTAEHVLKGVQSCDVSSMKMMSRISRSLDLAYSDICVWS